MKGFMLTGLSTLVFGSLENFLLIAYLFSIIVLIISFVSWIEKDSCFSPKE